MNMPTKVDVGEATRDTLAALALGDPNLVDAGLELRAGLRDRSGLDDRTFALVKLAAIMALDAPPTSYLWQVARTTFSGPPVNIMFTRRALVFSAKSSVWPG